jgi:hypothetical protein
MTIRATSSTVSACESADVISWSSSSRRRRCISLVTSMSKHRRPSMAPFSSRIARYVECQYDSAKPPVPEGFASTRTVSSEVSPVS